MSVWKFWNNPKQKTKDKTELEKDTGDNQSEEIDDLEEYSPESSPIFERQKNRHQMSVSRSGRYKQKLRKRSGILDHPDFHHSGMLDQPQHKQLLGRQRSDDSRSFCEEAEIFALRKVSCERCQECGDKPEYQVESRICDLHKRTDVEVVAI